MNIQAMLKDFEAALAKTSPDQIRAMVAKAVESNDPGVFIFSGAGAMLPAQLEFSFSIPSQWDGCLTSEAIGKPSSQREVDEISASQYAADSNELALAA